MRQTIGFKQAGPLSVGVNLHHQQRGVAEQFLNRLQIAAPPGKVRREGVAQRARRRAVGQAERAAHTLHRELHDARRQRSAARSDEQGSAGKLERAKIEIALDEPAAPVRSPARCGSCRPCPKSSRGRSRRWARARARSTAPPRCAVQRHKAAPARRRRAPRPRAREPRQRATPDRSDRGRRRSLAPWAGYADAWARARRRTDRSWRGPFFRESAGRSARRRARAAASGSPILHCAAWPGRRADPPAPSAFSAAKSARAPWCSARKPRKNRRSRP